MKHSIIITGQLSSIFTIRKEIPGNFEEKKLPFNGYKLIFDTKKEAEKALWEGFKNLRSDCDRFETKPEYRAKTWLRYDAGTAEIAAL